MDAKDRRCLYGGVIGVENLKTRKGCLTPTETKSQHYDKPNFVKSQYDRPVDSLIGWGGGH